MKTKITFDKSVTPFILTCFGFSVNRKGFVINKDKKSVLAPDGKPVNVKEFGGIIPTSNGPRLIRKTLVGIIQAQDVIEQNEA